MKIKLTLSVEKVLVDICRKNNVNISNLLELSIMHQLKLKKITYVSQEQEYY